MGGVDILLGLHTYMPSIRLTLDLLISLGGATLRVSAQHPAKKRSAIPIEARSRVEDIAAIKGVRESVKGERSWRPPQLGGARLPKGCPCHRRKSAGTIESMGWVEERAEPWRSARPRLGASTSLIHHVGWCRSVSPEKVAAFREPRPTKLGRSRRPFTFHLS